eukprot:TRINITY_DN9997_c0_g1_i1.p3 TRINITY_DN9997_c0_g1~~TRINITY_DN9997_c0_g1_i1.p3  ORF type:complete len:59 (+),score=9.80 TRINITY_DN9997_c0_g1_i1:261-437(+)
MATRLKKQIIVEDDDDDDIKLSDSDIEMENVTIPKRNNNLRRLLSCLTSLPINLPLLL